MQLSNRRRRNPPTPAARARRNARERAYRRYVDPALIERAKIGWPVTLAKLAERRAAVATLSAAPYHRSARWIAEVTGLSQRTVVRWRSRIRQESAA